MSDLQQRVLIERWLRHLTRSLALVRERFHYRHCSLHYKPAHRALQGAIRPVHAMQARPMQPARC